MASRNVIPRAVGLVRGRSYFFLWQLWTISNDEDPFAAEFIEHFLGRVKIDCSVTLLPQILIHALDYFA